VSRSFCVHCARTCQNLISFIPDFLEFTRSHFIREQTNVEIRLKAIFVGADTDGDGNMDIDEFNAMIAITQSSLSHQQLLRMYSEMTLNSRVDCDVFVRVARVFRFCAFEVGPVCGPSLSCSFLMAPHHICSQRKDPHQQRVRKCGPCWMKTGSNLSRFFWNL
jgi:hypothetical protein